jgi:hypothetical protein
MAAEHATFEDTYAGAPNRGRKTSKYPWAQWLNGSVWEINSEEDFFCTPESMVVNIRARAKLINASVRVSVAKSLDGNKTFIAFCASSKYVPVAESNGQAKVKVKKGARRSRINPDLQRLGA